MFLQNPGCRLSSGSAPRVRAKGHGFKRPGPRSGHCCRSGEGLRMVLPALAGCDRRGPALRRSDDPAATRRGTRPLTGPRPCQTQQNRGAVPAGDLVALACCSRHSDPTLVTRRYPENIPTNIDPAPSSASPVTPRIPVSALDQCFTESSPWPGFPLSPHSVDTHAVIGGWAMPRALHSITPPLSCRIRSPRAAILEPRADLQ